MQPEGEWAKVRGVITPGSDPLWKCSVCGGDEHVMGIETLYNLHHKCKECGSINKYPYPWEKGRRAMDDLELKPCPFCGCIPKYTYTQGWHGYSKNEGRLTCSICDVVMSAYGDYSYNTAYQHLVKKWNRRTTNG